MDKRPEEENVDKDLDDVAIKMLLKHTEIARRLLFKAVPVDGEAASYSVPAPNIFKIFKVKERSGDMKPSLHWFRAIAKKCPAVVGGFNEEKDTLTFTLPQEPCKDFDSALKAFANVSLETLKASVGPSRIKDARGGARFKKDSD